MAKKRIHIQNALYPLSILYGLGVRFRNRLFDWDILHSETFDIPIICVGNLTVGGTGKTPHVEYLIRLLSPYYRIALLSRGYKRKTTGFVLADPTSTPTTLGDEPYQIKSKFPEIMVAVDADRRNGIRRLLEQANAPNVILLDDAFQHRYVKPGLSIVLSDYNRPFYEDTYLPAGRLREGKSGIKRADLIIVSKTPDTTTEQEIQDIRTDIQNVDKPVFFSTLSYQSLRSVFTDQIDTISREAVILLVTGIANPEPIERYIGQNYKLAHSMVFADHHDFNETDIRKIADKFKSISNKEKAIIVTEKDAVRLRHNPFINDYLKENIYFLPLEIVFLHNETNRFNQIILDYVAENQRNS